MSRFWLVCLGVMLSATAAYSEWSTPVPVTEVNTIYSEANPFLTSDGLTLYFTRGKTDSFYYDRLYQATRTTPSGPFANVKEISALNYSNGHIASPWVSADNLRMYYMRTEPGNHYRLKFTQRNSPTDLWAPGGDVAELNGLGNIDHVTLSADERTIIFNDDGAIAGGRGGYDLWMASRADRFEPFGAVRNLTEVSTTSWDLGPSLSPDGLNLFYFSYRNGNTGIFEASRTTINDTFDNIAYLPGLTVPGAQSAYPAIDSTGTTLYCRYLAPGSSTYDIYISTIPEPITLLFLAGGCGLLMRRKR